MGGRGEGDQGTGFPSPHTGNVRLASAFLQYNPARGTLGAIEKHGGGERERGRGTGDR